MKKLFLFCSLSAILFACNENDKAVVAGEKTVNMDSVKQFINAANLKFSNAMAAGDSAALVALYHSEAAILGPNMPIMTNRTAMGTMVKELPKMGVTKVTLKSEEFLHGGDYITERGVFEMGDASKTFDKGKYLVVWKKEGDQWKMYRDMWNSDLPATQAH